MQAVLHLSVRLQLSGYQRANRCCKTKYLCWTNGLDVAIQLTLMPLSPKKPPPHRISCLMLLIRQFSEQSNHEITV